jgi:hypothetical protein
MLLDICTFVSHPLYLSLAGRSCRAENWASTTQGLQGCGLLLHQQSWCVQAAHQTSTTHGQFGVHIDVTVAAFMLKSISCTRYMHLMTALHNSIRTNAYWQLPRMTHRHAHMPVGMMAQAEWCYLSWTSLM